MASTLKDSNYEEARLPDPNNPDSLINVLTDKSSGSNLVVSPMVFLNMRIGKYEKPTSFEVTSGVAARSVNSSTGLDIYLGLSLGLGGRLYISGGILSGRKEKRLVNLNTKLPAEITTDDMVGIERVFAPAFSISVKI